MATLAAIGGFFGRRHIKRIDSHGTRIKKLEERTIAIKEQAVTRVDMSQFLEDIRRERLEAHAATQLHQDTLHRQNQGNIGALSNQVELLNKTLMQILLKKDSND